MAAINLASLLKGSQEEIETKKEKVMSLNLKLMHIAGIVAPPGVKASSFKMTLYQLYVLCCYLVYIPVLSGQVLALHHFWGNIDITTNNIFTLLGGLMGFIEATYARFNARELQELFETFQNKVVPRMVGAGLKEKKQIFASATIKARRITLAVMIILDTMVAAWIPAPFIKHLMEEHNNVTNNETEDENKWLNFCYVIWFPTDITVSPYFEIMYLMQCIVYITGTTYVTAIEGSIATMMVHISAQFEILHTALEDMDMIITLREEEKKKEKRVGELRFLKPTKLFGRVVNNISLEDPDEPHVIGLGFPAEKIAQECKAMPTIEAIGDAGEGGTKIKEPSELTCYLANFVQYHQAIINFVADVNKAAGPIFVVCFFTRQFLACVMSFQVALTWGQDNNILKYILGLAGTMCAPLIFCWYGTAIIQNSLEVKRAAFECQWYYHPQMLKHFLLMIILRSQKAVYLSGCQFYIVSLETFGKMMNTVYAYFTLLKNQYEN